MEYVLIPRYKEMIAFVELGLDENEREEFYRLKKVQQKRKDMDAIAEAQRLARFAIPEQAESPEAPSILDDESTDDSDILF
jgi:V-type H+-transporting ATPase subunit D